MLLRNFCGKSVAGYNEESRLGKGRTKTGRIVKKLMELSRKGIEGLKKAWKQKQKKKRFYWHFRDKVITIWVVDLMYRIRTRNEARMSPGYLI